MSVQTLLEGWCDSVPDVVIKGIELDSRRVQEGQAFLAVAGASTHGLAYAAQAQANGASVTYHDPCRLGRHGGVIGQPRHMLEELGFDFREADSNGRENYCCGGGCGEYVIQRSAPLRQKAFEIKKREFENTGAETVVTGCANCRINLMIGADNSDWQTPITGLVETVAAKLAD